jgi:hypothetical protein
MEQIAGGKDREFQVSAPINALGNESGKLAATKLIGNAAIRDTAKRVFLSTLKEDFSIESIMASIDNKTRKK